VHIHQLRAAATQLFSMPCRCFYSALEAFIVSVGGLQLQVGGSRAPLSSLRRCCPSIPLPRSSTISRAQFRTLQTQTAGHDRLDNQNRVNLTGADVSSNADGSATERAVMESAETSTSQSLPKGMRRKERYNQTVKGQAELRAKARLAEGSKSGQPDMKASRKPEVWAVQKEALRAKFPEGWNPRKKLSPDAMTGIRALHKQFPDEYSSEVLAKRFEVSPEAIRRILRSKWQPSAEEEESRQERWFNRGKQVWERWAELGKKPPRRWRAEGIVRDPVWNEGRKQRHAMRQGTASVEYPDAHAIRRRVADDSA
jgi:hypothetical protein